MNETAAAYPGNDRKPSPWFSAIILAVFTVLAFANAMHDELVFDDKAFVGPDRHYKLETLSDAFSQDVWRDVRPGQGFYRPLMLISMEAQNQLFGEWVAAYHLVNVAQHLAASLLLLGFLRHLLKLRGLTGRKAEFGALIAAVIFAIHPIHTEVVNSLFNGSSISVAMLAIAGLWWLMSRLDEKPFSAWLGFGVAYSMAILFKESALSLPGIAVAMIFLMTEGRFWERVRRFLPVFWMLLPIAAYFYLRIQALSSGAASPGDDAGVVLQTMQISGSSYLDDIGIVLIQALKALVWPWPLQLYYALPGTLVTYLGTTAWLLLLVAAVVLYVRDKPSLAAGISFFLIAFLPASRLINPDLLPPHFADRYIYYPSIGFSIVLAFALAAVARRSSTRLITALSLPVILLFTGLTWSRNHDWSSDMNLFKSELQKENFQLAAVRLVFIKFWEKGQFQQIMQVCDENPHFYTMHELYANICATVYVQHGRKQEAIEALEASLVLDNEWLNRNLMLGNLLIQTGRKQEGADRYTYAINRLEDPALKEFYKGLLYLQLYPNNRRYLEVARDHMFLAQRIDPELKEAQIYLERIKRSLNPELPAQPQAEGEQALPGFVLPMPRKKEPPSDG